MEQASPWALPVEIRAGPFLFGHNAFEPSAGSYRCQHCVAHATTSAPISATPRSWVDDRAQSCDHSHGCRSTIRGRGQATAPTRGFHPENARLRLRSSATNSAQRLGAEHWVPLFSYAKFYGHAGFGCCWRRSPAVRSGPRPRRLGVQIKLAHEARHSEPRITLDRHGRVGFDSALRARHRQPLLIEPLARLLAPIPGLTGKLQEIPQVMLMEHANVATVVAHYWRAEGDRWGGGSTAVMAGL